MLDTVAPVSIYSHVDMRKLLFHLIGFVTDLCHGSFRGGQYETFRFPFVSPAEDGNLKLLLQKPYQILRMGGLSCASHGDVANVDDGHIKALRPEYIPVKQLVADVYTYPVEEGEGVKPFVYLDKVVFHLFREFVVRV